MCKRLQPRDDYDGGAVPSTAGDGSPYHVLYGWGEHPGLPPVSRHLDRGTGHSMPSTTVVDCVLSWFPTHAGGGHHGSVAAAGFLSRQCDPGDGTYVGAVADGGGATDWAPIRPTRGSVACLGVYAWLAEPDRAQKRLATRRSQWRSDPIRRPAFVGTGDLGRRCPP